MIMTDTFCSRNLCSRNQSATARIRMAILALVALIVIIPSLAMAGGRDHGDLYLQMKQAIEKSGKSALDVAGDILKTYPGHMVGFEAEVRRDKLIYEYKVMQPAEKRELEVKVNAIDGQVIDIENDRLDRDLPRTEKEMEGVVVFSEAWRKAEEMFGRYVVEAELEEEHGRLFYEFEILESFRDSKVLIDARTGNPIPVFERH